MYCPFCTEKLLFEGDTADCQCGKRFILPELHVEPHHDTSYEIAERVYICNKEHDFFLESGIVSDRDRNYTRIRMTSLNKRIDRYHLWVPNHWLKALPEELRSVH